MYKRQVKGRGCSVWDDKGQEYLDLYGGHAVISIGHCQIFGNWKPWRIAGAAFFFGATKTIAYTYTSIPFLATLSLPATAYKLIPYVATLILLAFTSKH